MNISSYLYRAKRLKPRVLIQKVFELLIVKLVTWIEFFKYKVVSSYTQGNSFDSEDYLEIQMMETLAEENFWVERTYDALNLLRKGKVDLLGSGWVDVTYGFRPKSFLDASYKPNSFTAVLGRNEKYSNYVLEQLTSDYEKYDWHSDFKTGFSWDRNCHSKASRFGNTRGVDIKVPWELARMQQLPLLALFYLKNKDKKVLVDIENIVLDFIGQNPPLFGVNWICAMDVAIRSANICFAISIVHGAQARFSSQFYKIVGNSFLDHFSFIKKNHEKKADFTGNHYLANIAGMIFLTSTFRPLQKYRDYWVNELLEQLDLQFNEDGSNFEGSTAYHRLSAELVLYSFSLLKYFKVSLDWKIIETKMKKIKEFLEHSMDHCHQLIQIGDNDSGRFFKFHLFYSQDLVEDQLNHSTTVTALESFYKSKTEYKYLDSLVVSSLMNGQTLCEQDEHSFLTSFKKDFIEDYQKFKQFSEYEFLFGHEIEVSQNRVSIFNNFGIVFLKNKNFSFSFRCGNIGQNGKGGHDHNDQLSLTLKVGDKSLVIDPGTFVYTPSSVIRNKYRSIYSHFSPRLSVGEPASLSEGLFYLGDSVPGELLLVKNDTILGRYKAKNYSKAVYREIKIFSNRMVVKDFYNGDEELLELSAEIDTDGWQCPVSLSMGYGHNNTMH